MGTWASNHPDFVHIFKEATFPPVAFLSELFISMPSVVFLFSWDLFYFFHDYLLNLDILLIIFSFTIS